MIISAGFIILLKIYLELYERLEQTQKMIIFADFPIPFPIY
jgi:hypothetical protein